VPSDKTFELLLNFISNFEGIEKGKEKGARYRDQTGIPLRGRGGGKAEETFADSAPPKKCSLSEIYFETPASIRKKKTSAVKETRYRNTWGRREKDQAGQAGRRNKSGGSSTS